MSAVEWFRMYHDVLHDPKIQRLAVELRWRWVELLCIASKADERGVLPALEDCAYLMRLTPQRAEQVIRTMVESGLIDASDDGKTLKIHAWESRQKPSDSSKKRVDEFRKRHRNGEGEEPCNGAVTLHKQPSHAGAHAGADSDTEAEKEDPPSSPEGDKPKRKRRPPFDPSTMLLPEWIPRKLWDDWIDARTKKNGRPTQGSLETAIEKLDRWRSDGEDIREVLENAVIGGYAGLFLPNNRSRNGNGHAATAPPPRPRSEPKPITRAEYERRLVEMQEQ